MKKTIIGIDVDNVIADFTSEFINRFNSITKKSLKKDDLIYWNFKKVIYEKYNDISCDIANEIIDKDFILDLKPFKDVKKTLNLLYENKDIEIKIITALKPELIKYRNKWFCDNFKNIKVNIYYEKNKNKIDVDYLIEDSTDNLISVEEKIGSSNCLLIKHPYNANCNMYNKFNSLEEAVNHILQKEKLDRKSK